MTDFTLPTPILTEDEEDALDEVVDVVDGPPFYTLYMVAEGGISIDWASDFQSSLSLSGRSDMVITPTLKGITNKPLVRPTTDASFTTTPDDGVPVVYLVGVTSYVTGFNGTPINTPITFSANVTLPMSDDLQQIIEYYWKFGDGTEGWGQTVQHTYKVANINCQASLRVTDNFGRRNYVRKSIYLTD